MAGHRGAQGPGLRGCEDRVWLRDWGDSREGGGGEGKYTGQSAREGPDLGQYRRVLSVSVVRSQAACLVTDGQDSWPRQCARAGRRRVPFSVGSGLRTLEITPYTSVENSANGPIFIKKRALFQRKKGHKTGKI